MKTLTQTFEEILKNLDPEGKNYPEVFNNLVNAVKARDEEVLGEEEIENTFHDDNMDINLEAGYKNMKLREIKQKMEETL